MRLSSLALALGFAVSGPWSQAALAACDPPKWDLPTRFPIESFVLSVLVESPATTGSDGRTVLRGRLHDPVHVPRQSPTFEILIRDDDDGCPGEVLSAEELRDRFARGDELLVVAYPLSNGGLETFLGWVAYASQLRRNPVDNVYDYVSTLFRLETLESDTERVQPLRSIALYLSDPERYRALLEAQLEIKRLRRRMMKVHEFLHRPPQGGRSQGRGRF